MPAKVKPASKKKVAKPRAPKPERVPTHPVHLFTPEAERHLTRVRLICSGLPNTTEKLSHGSPTFFHKKVYCTFTTYRGKESDQRPTVWIPVPPGDQATLIRTAPTTYFKPPYVGVHGWVGILLDQIDDEDLAIHLHTAWTMMGPHK